MRFEPSPAGLVERFDRAVPPDPDVRRRKMFGWPALVVAGNMFASLHRESFVLRLGPYGVERMLELGGRPFEPMAGRPMRGYVVLPVAIVEDDAALAGWVGQALEFARTLPPK